MPKYLAQISLIRLRPVKSVSERSVDLGIVLFLSLLAWPIFFRDAHHFFQGDTLFWLANRYRSVADFVHGLVVIDPGGWFRPLANRTIESVLFPYVGMNPAPYRVVGFLLFSITIVYVYFFFLFLAAKRTIALLGAMFFTFHSVNAYVTYDVAFTPELAYATFYVGAAFAFVRFLRRGRVRPPALSVGFFGLSLLCKEPAITLPITLFAIALITDTRTLSWRKRLRESVGAVKLHLALLAIYLTWTVGFLNLGRSSFDHPFGIPTQSEGYQFVFGKTVPGNLDTALSLAFNLPRNWYSQSHLSKGLLNQLRIFRGAVVLFVLTGLIRGPRRLIVLGLFCFLIAVSPPLPLYNHFLPHYLFLPLIGFSLMIGVAFDGGYDLLRQFARPLALPVLTAIFAQLIFINARSVWNEQENNQLLGRSARIAQETIDTVRALRRLNGEQTIYFLNDKDRDLPWQHGWGTVFQLSFPLSAVRVMYSSDGTPHRLAGLDTQRLLVLDYRHEVFTDATGIALREPNLPRLFDPTQSPMFLIRPNNVLAGRDSYVLSAPMQSKEHVVVLYALNSGAAATFDTRLDDHGEAHFKVGAETPRGVYRFLGLRDDRHEDWLYVDERLVVR